MPRSRSQQNVAPFQPSLPINPQAATLDQALLNSNLEVILQLMSDRILVINPNSTEAVTQGIDTAMEPLRMPGGPAIECVTLKEGPPASRTRPMSSRSSDRSATW